MSDFYLHFSIYKKKSFLPKDWYFTCEVILKFRQFQLQNALFSYLPKNEQKISVFVELARFLEEMKRHNLLLVQYLSFLFFCSMFWLLTWIRSVFSQNKNIKKCSVSLAVFGVRTLWKENSSRKRIECFAV